MNASLTLEQIIQQELELVLAEQRNAVFKSAPSSKFNATRIAKQLYNAKGTVVDDEKSALDAIRQIKNINQYQQVFFALKNLPDRLIDGDKPRNIASYLKSFMDASDRIEAAIHLYDVLPASQFNWTVKKLVSYDELKSALSAMSGRGSKFNSIRFSNLSGRAINQIQKMFNDPAMYKNIAQKDAESEADGFNASDVLFRPFVSTEYYLKYNSLSAWINAPGGLREMIYSPLGIGVTTAASLIPSPWTKIPVATLFGILAIDDITRISQGDSNAWLDLIGDSLGMAIGGSGSKIFAVIKDKFRTLFAWIKNGGVLVKISQGMFKLLFSMVKTIANTPLGKLLAKGEPAVAALQSTIRSVFSKSMSTLKGIMQKLKASMPNPIKRWATNALDSMKEVSINYYMEELKPMFDSMKMLARVTKEFFKAPETAVLDLARRLGIKSDWVMPVAKGAKIGTIAAYIEHINKNLPNAIKWWETWQMEQMTKEQIAIWAKDLEKNIDEKTRTFVKKPGQSINIYAHNPNGTPEWILIESKIIKTQPGVNGPIRFQLYKQIGEYSYINIPIQMQSPGEINQFWVKSSELSKIKK
jgi:hypothetical protein